MILKFLDFLLESKTQYKELINGSYNTIEKVLNSKKLEHSKRVAELTKKIIKNKLVFFEKNRRFLIDINQYFERKSFF